ncbi:nitroreductase [Roseicyclus sp. F158]|uniref:Putative NAD(P)H nitroreductase n=1 Tax=Tropicimonas omnivorans TaxID=3075590 RepID=A0ABU3DFD0_9RHOB|nr:nitroreductase [Roseicyclus sp. F158]MDT0682421.1 nitroreductase [Roseicyclus sp. F158]
MPDPSPAAMDFLLTRRSRPAKTLEAPYPDQATLETLLTAAARTPDHGALVPWRFIVLGKGALERMAALAETRGTALDLSERDLGKGVSQFADSGCAIAVIGSPKDSAKVPQIEQTLSVGAACYGLLSAALASGWGANWLTGWPSHDAEFCREGLSLGEGEYVAAFVHIGTETAAPPERPRPELSDIVTFLP